MPELEDLRRWLRGEDVEGLPERRLGPEARQPKRNLVEALKTKRQQQFKNRQERRYKISVDGCDALLFFGKHKGSAISQLVKTLDGRSYLTWLAGQGFPSDLIDVVRYQMERPLKKSE